MPEAVINTVKAIKKGGAAVGIIVLLGAGGKTFAAEHVRETIKVINKLTLDENDILYLSELIESEGIPYQQKAYDDNLIPLSEQERIDQGDRIENGLKFNTHRGMPHISRYDIREFIY
jgi:hypothetical protein